MTTVSLRMLAACSTLLLSVLIGCGTGAEMAPTMLVLADMNGTYTVTAGGSGSDPVLFNGTFVSAQPKSQSGSGYADATSGVLINTANMNLGSCNGAPFNLAGTITNPSGNDVLLNVTGTTPGGGTVTVTGSLSKGSGPVLGSVVSGSMTITGGSCPMSATSFVAKRQ